MSKIIHYTTSMVPLLVLCLFSQGLYAATGKNTRKDLVAPKVTDLLLSESINPDLDADIHILVTVSDNVKIKSVFVYYREIGKKKYRRSSMKSVKELANYDYATDLKKIKAPGLEYYIQVEDSAGNVSLHGNAISPLVFNTGKKLISQKKYAKGAHAASLGFGIGSDKNSAHVGFEFYQMDQLGVGIRANKLNYEFTENERQESGTSLGLEAYVRYFPTSLSYKGFYVGGALGISSLSWQWDDVKTVDDNEQTQEEVFENGHGDAVNVALHLGWRFHFAYSGFYFEPSIALGRYFEFNVETSDNKNELNLENYVTGGLIFGVAF